MNSKILELRYYINKFLGKIIALDKPTLERKH